MMRRYGKTDKGCKRMKVKTWLATAGLGMVAGAAAILMVPRHSQFYHTANDAAQTVKQEATKWIDRMVM